MTSPVDRRPPMAASVPRGGIAFVGWRGTGGLRQTALPPSGSSQRTSDRMAGRASNGESTIYRRADGRWHSYVSVGFKLDGTLDRRHVSSKSRGVVVAKVRELERKRDSGTVSETSTP